MPNAKLKRTHRTDPRGPLVFDIATLGPASARSETRTVPAPADLGTGMVQARRWGANWRRAGRRSGTGQQWPAGGYIVDRDIPAGGFEGALRWQYPSGRCRAATPDRGAPSGRPGRRSLSRARSAGTRSCRTLRARPAGPTTGARSLLLPEESCSRQTVITVAAVTVSLPAADGRAANAHVSVLPTKPGVQVSDELLDRALMHRSFAYENGGLPTNERLEF